MGDKWIADLEAQLEKMDPSAELERQRIRCIYRVPKVMRELNREAYTPQLVSYGPYHHDLDYLKPTEPYKRQALFHYLRRAGKTLAEVVEAMRPEARVLMDSYDGLEEPWTDEDRFLGLMILDGCFFLDLLIWHAVDFSRPYMPIRLFMDELMLENQLPLSVLAILIDVGGHKMEDNRSFVKFYFDTDMQIDNIRRLGLHHLDLYKKTFAMKGEYRYDPYNYVRPATELFQAGIGFEHGTHSFKDVSFSNGILRLPFLKVNDSTKPLLLNFLAFEQVHKKGNAAVTSYAFLMNNLINTTKDVVLLREKGIIIKGWVGSDKDIATLFNSLTEAMMFTEWTGTENVNKKLNEYCSRRRHKWRASFIQTYLSNPWVFISLLGASILLLLTVTQTVYTILPYYK